MKRASQSDLLAATFATNRTDELPLRNLRTLARSGLILQSPGPVSENGSFLEFDRRLLGILGPKSSIDGLQRLLAIRKTRSLRAFLIRRRKFSKNGNGWLATQC